MIIQSLKLKNFRNYELLNLTFHPVTNIFHGDNAQGKTNILEAVYLAGTTKSHRGTKDRDMISFGEEESHIEVKVLKNGVPFRIDIHLKKNSPKGAAINRMPVKRASELFGIINLVFFSPEDLNIIKNGPAQRRRFMDLELSQLDKIYLNNLADYNRVVNQRNRLLKEMAFQEKLKDTLEIWDMQLVRYGERVMEGRKKFLREINEIVGDIHGKLTGGRERLVICFKIKDMDIRKFGSQGQQRTAALSLKLAEIEIVKRVIHDTPVLLLDDVLSELDKHRQNYLLDSIHDIQTLITCTGVEEFVNHRFSINKVFLVQNGQVTNEN